MDRRALLAKLKTAINRRKKHALVALAAVAVVAGGLTGIRATRGPKKNTHEVAHAEPRKAEHAKSDTAKDSHEPQERSPASAHDEPPKAEAHAPAPPAGPGWTPSGVLKASKSAIASIQEKVDRLRRAEEENRRLRLENAHLKLRAEGLQFDCQARDAASRTHELEMKLSGETGAKVGRTLASIHYRPPTHLLPPQLYTLAVSYFNAREDEKAAVILTFLTGLEENDTYKTPKNMLMNGVAWYRLDNFEVADQYFGRVLETKETPDNVQYQAQARLWRGLVAERTNRHDKAQHWLRELLDYHPHSTEAGWVNSKEAKRVPASGTHSEDE
jgi:tetratricopeptide (TPR) repeat protein